MYEILTGDDPNEVEAFGQFNSNLQGAFSMSEKSKNKRHSYGKKNTEGY